MSDFTYFILVVVCVQGSFSGLYYGSGLPLLPALVTATISGFLVATGLFQIGQALEQREREKAKEKAKKELEGR